MALQSAQPASIARSASVTPTTPITPSTPSTSSKPATKDKFKLLDAALLSSCKGHSVTVPSSCYDLKDIVTITVKDGQKRRVYTMLRGLLRWHSSYFAAALDPNGGWSHDETPTLDFDCEHSTFDAFCCWLFTGRLKDTVAEPTSHDDVYLSYRTLVDIWVFADLRGVPALGNAAIDMIHEKTYGGATDLSKTIKHLYKTTAAGSQLRKFIVATVKAISSVDSITYQAHLFTKEFLCDVLPDLASGEAYLTIGAGVAADRCQWHDHSGPGGKLRLEGR